MRGLAGAVPKSCTQLFWVEEGGRSQVQRVNDDLALILQEVVATNKTESSPRPVLRPTDFAGFIPSPA